MDGTVLSTFWRPHLQRTLCIFLDRTALEQHGVVFDTQPGPDKVRVVLAGGVTGLPWCMPGKRSGYICQVYDLAIRWHGQYHLWLIRECRSHVDCINIAAHGIWASIEDFIQRFDPAQRMSIGHFVYLAVLPL